MEKTEIKNSMNTSILYQKKLNIKEAAEALSMSRTTFNKWREAGQLPPSIKIAEREFWLESDLERWVIDQNPHLQKRKHLEQSAAKAMKKMQEMRESGQLKVVGARDAINPVSL